MMNVSLIKKNANISDVYFLIRMSFNKDGPKRGDSPKAYNFETESNQNNVADLLNS